MQLVIAEKPSVGMALAKALDVTDKKDGYIEGNGYIVSWCVGHLVSLANADMYDEKFKKWDIADLPIIPDEWQFIIAEDKNKQFGILRQLMEDNRVTEVVNACDAGREGELIFRLVYNKALCNKPIKRLWISSMEEKAIRDGFDSLRDGKDYENLHQSALCRAKADWIVGINATRLFSKLYNRTLNVGRVQTPTLAMLYERENSISNFQKEKYWSVHLKFVGLDAVHEKVKEQGESENIRRDCDGKEAIVKSVKTERKTVNPPHLYDLTTLQREANRLYGFTAQQTLDYTQSLYEMKLVTYPRTDSQYITDDMDGTARSIAESVAGKIPHFSGIVIAPDTKRVINNKKVSDHHAIIPTAEVSSTDLISVMPDIIKSASMTADWENALSLMAQGKFTSQQFMVDIEKLVDDIIGVAKESVDESKVSRNGGEVIGTCPRCGKNVVVTPKAYSCEDRNCGFVIWKNDKFFEKARKPLTKEMAASLIKNGKIAVKGLYSEKSGKNYDATVCLDDTGKYVNYKLEFATRKKKK